MCAVQEVDPELVDMAIHQLQTTQELAEETDEALGYCAPYIRNRILSSLYTDKLGQCQLFYVRPHAPASPPAAPA